MFESFDESTFQPSESTPSASPVQGTLHDALHDTVQMSALECSESKGYTIEQITSNCNIARRTAFKYASEVVQTWYWLPEYQFRIDGIYSEFALSELKRRKALGNLENYRSVVHGENEGAIAQFKASQLPQQQATEQPTEQDSGELAKVVPVEVVAGLSTLQENLYKVDEFGSSRLALANERFNQTGQNLNSTLDQTREAMRNLAMQQYQSSQADEVERRERLNREYLTAYQEELALIQARNMAREDARMQAQAMEQAIKGKAQAPSDSNAV